MGVADEAARLVSAGDHLVTEPSQDLVSRESNQPGGGIVPENDPPVQTYGAHPRDTMGVAEMP